MIRALLCALFLPAAALAQQVVVHIDLSEQQMQVFEDGQALYDWPVSTARAGKCTPTGIYTPEWMTPFHRSTLYNGAPMPWSIFFRGNYAIHGTDQVARLGTPASAGCVRLDPAHAETLYRMVARAGLPETRVVITD